MQKRDASSPPQGGEPVLFLNGVSKSFPGVRALNDVSFTLRAGEVTALVGENGAGKSTIVKILTGIYSADAGDVTVDGQLRKFSVAARFLGCGHCRHPPGNGHVR